MTPLPSADPAPDQAAVTEIEAEAWSWERSPTTHRGSRVDRLLADRAQREERIRALYGVLRRYRYWECEGGQNRHVLCSPKGGQKCPCDCAPCETRALLGEAPDEDHD